MPRLSHTLLMCLGFECCSAGCVILPTPEAFNTQNRWHGTVGAGTSAASLKIGTSTRADVLAKLGDPWNRYDEPFQRPPSHFWWYEKQTRVGFLVFLWPFVHGGPVQDWDRSDSLGIWFDREGRVARYEEWAGEPSEAVRRELQDESPARRQGKRRNVRPAPRHHRRRR